MRIKFEISDGGKVTTLCPHNQKVPVVGVMARVKSIVCVKCPHYQGTEGNEVICGREEKE